MIINNMKSRGFGLDIMTNCIVITPTNKTSIYSVYSFFK